MESHGYQKIRTIGKGSFAHAHLCRDKSGNQVVIKEINLSSMSKAEQNASQNEVKVLSKLEHPCVVKYVDHFSHGTKLSIVMEYADGGDLSTLIRDRKTPLSEAEALHYFVQVCLALKYVHEKKILHRDLKAQNVFLSHSKQMVKLGDFGISTSLKSTMALAKTQCGTPFYFSPEMCQNAPYNSKSDIWSLGCLLYELCTLSHPFQGKNMRELMHSICSGSYRPLPPTFSHELRQLISDMLTIDSSKRPSVSQILQLDLVRGKMRNIVSTGQGATRPSPTPAPAPSARPHAGAQPGEGPPRPSQPHHRGAAAPHVPPPPAKDGVQAPPAWAPRMHHIPPPSNPPATKANSSNPTAGDQKPAPAPHSAKPAHHPHSRDRSNPRTHQPAHTPQPQHQDKARPQAHGGKQPPSHPGHHQGGRAPPTESTREATRAAPAPTHPPALVPQPEREKASSGRREGPSREGSGNPANRNRTQHSHSPNPNPTTGTCGAVPRRSSKASGSGNGQAQPAPAPTYAGAHRRATAQQKSWQPTQATVPKKEAWEGREGQRRDAVREAQTEEAMLSPGAALMNRYEQAMERQRQPTVAPRPAPSHPASKSAPQVQVKPAPTEKPKPDSRAAAVAPLPPVPTTAVQPPAHSAKAPLTTAQTKPQGDPKPAHANLPAAARLETHQPNPVAREQPNQLPTDLRASTISPPPAAPQEPVRLCPVPSRASPSPTPEGPPVILSRPPPSAFQTCGSSGSSQSTEPPPPADISLDFEEGAATWVPRTGYQLPTIEVEQPSSVMEESQLGGHASPSCLDVGAAWTRHNEEETIEVVEIVNQGPREKTEFEKVVGECSVLLEKPGEPIPTDANGPGTPRVDDLEATIDDMLLATSIQELNASSNGLPEVEDEEVPEISASMVSPITFQDSPLSANLSTSTMAPSPMVSPGWGAQEVEAEGEVSGGFRGTALGLCTVMMTILATACANPEMQDLILKHAASAATMR